MPTVVNGIGTWYYGKKRIHRLHDACRFCQRLGELESYDTTLYFVVLFIPLLPLSRKRILEKCPACQKHRVLSLKEWENQKSRNIADLFERLQQSPDDRVIIISAIDLAVSFQDQELFGKLVGTLTGHSEKDAAIQARLGLAYGDFARWPEAETAYRASLAVQDNPEIRQRLALTLLKQGRPEDAASYLRHILDQKLKDNAGMIYLLVEGYQAQGMHKEALEIMDRRDAAFPDLSQQKEYKIQRKTSERYQHSGKRIKSPYLTESGKAGYREGRWTAKLPRFIGPLVLLGLLCAYFGTALWQGQFRKVYLVNGGDKPYTVAINGKEQKLPPGIPTLIQVPEGEIVMEFKDDGAAHPPLTCRVETPFFTRPFQRRTFVVNPDQLAILLWQETEYSEKPHPVQDRSVLHVRNVLYALENLDYEFTAFPQTVQAKKGETIKKRRIGMIPNLTPEVRLHLTAEKLDAMGQVAYAKRWLSQEPNDVVWLYWLVDQLKDQKGLEFVQSGLAVRPVRVEWHRAYQYLMEKTQPEVDLQPQYQKLVVEMKEHPDALYLLGRIEDLDQGDKRFHQAAKGPSPSFYALHALGFRALVQGHFAEALSWMDKAVKMAPRHPLVRQDYRSALLASRNLDRLQEEMRTPEEGLGSRMSGWMDQLRIHGAKGDRVKMRATIEEAVQALQEPGNLESRQIVQAMMEMVRCCQENDVAGLLKIKAQIPGLPPFEVALLEGNVTEAANLAPPENNRSVIHHALLYLAALNAETPKLAEDQWQTLLSFLDKGDRYTRQLGGMLRGRQPLQFEQFLRFPIEPKQKSILAALVGKRFPDQGKDFLQLARGLDFHKDVTSLCLWKFVE